MTMARSRFVPDQAGIDELRLADEVVAERREAAKRIVAEAKRIAPKDQGSYKKGLRMVHDRRQDLITASGTAPHSHLVEWGTGPRTTSDGRSTGAMPKLRVLARALDAAGRSS